MDSMTSPKTAVVDRWELQDRFIMPIVDELKQKDIKEEQEKRKERNDQKQKEDKDKDQDKDKGKDEEQGEQGEKGEKGEKSEKEEGQEGQEEGQEGKEGNEGNENEQNESGDGGQKKQKSNGNKKTKQEGEDSEDNPGSLDFDPNELWKDEYDTAEKATPNAVSEEEIQKSIEEYEKWKKENVKSEKEIKEELDQEYADKIGVGKKELQQYRDIVKKLEEIINPDTGQSVIGELRDIIRRIISKRKNKKFAPQYPVDEGDYLIEPAELVASVKAGNLYPKVWETHELKEQQDDKFGEVEISFVCDRSGSMDGQKLVEQQKAMVLVMEALKELSDLCQIEKSDMTKSLEVKHEVYTFQATDEDSKPVKKMSAESTENERIKTVSTLSSCPGSSTTDFVPLETIEQGIDDKTKKKIKEGELKKIVFVMTDGDSDDKLRVKGVVNKMREDGVIVIGIGITNEGASALKTYAPTAHLAETAEKLPVVLAEALKEHLSDIR